MKLAIIISHPIQYNVPLFRLLAERGIIEIMVFYSWGNAVIENKYDPGFGRVIKWDIPLLEGYPSQFLDNTARRPGSDHFLGIINPDIVPRIDAWKPDAVLIYGWNFKSHLMTMRHYKGKLPVYFRGDSTLLDERPGLRHIIRNIFLKWVYCRVDKVFYVGQRNKEYFLRAGLKDSELILAPHAIDNDFFQLHADEHEAEAKQWRQTLKIGQDSLVFLFAGKMERKKAPLLLLEAFKAAQFPESTHLIFAGSGELDGALMAAAKSSNIHFIGFQNQKRMPVVYRLGDVFILPSAGPAETWGLAINEAMACGRPVIASSKCGGAVDLIRDGLNGYIFESGNKKDLQHKLSLFQKNKAEIRKMGNQAFLHIRNFSLLRIAEAVEQTVSSRHETRSTHDG
jgi:glycosyltransferase involved in cell wall biosynthesis